METLRDFFRRTAEHFCILPPKMMVLNDQDLLLLERNLRPEKKLGRDISVNDRVAVSLDCAAQRVQEFCEARQHRYTATVREFTGTLREFASHVFIRKFDLVPNPTEAIEQNAFVDLLKQTHHLHSVVEHELSNHDLRLQTVDDVPAYLANLHEFSALLQNISELAAAKGLSRHLPVNNADFVEEAISSCFPDLDRREQDHGPVGALSFGL